MIVIIIMESLIGILKAIALYSKPMIGRDCHRKPIIFLRSRSIPTSTKHLYNMCTMSAQRLRRWSNIVHMLYKCFVFAGIALQIQTRVRLCESEQ